MSLLRVTAFASLVFACLALPQERAVPNPKTPNQILDAIAERAAANIGALGWDVTKKIQNSYSDLPLQIEEYSDTTERVEITNAEITGFDTLRRSKSASFANAKSLLKGTLMFKNATASADYALTFAGVGQAPADTKSGRVEERVATLFVDVEVALSSLVPQNIQSYNVRTGYDNLDELTNMENDDMETIHSAGIRKALRHLVENTVEKNIKVQVNKAIQQWKAETTA